MIGITIKELRQKVQDDGTVIVFSNAGNKIYTDKETTFTLDETTT